MVLSLGNSELFVINLVLKQTLGLNRGIELNRGIFMRLSLSISVKGPCLKIPVKMAIDQLFEKQFNFLHNMKALF